MQTIFGNSPGPTLSENHSSQNSIWKREVTSHIAHVTYGQYSVILYNGLAAILEKKTISGRWDFLGLFWGVRAPYVLYSPTNSIKLSLINLINFEITSLAYFLVIPITEHTHQVWSFLLI